MKLVRYLIILILTVALASIGMTTGASAEDYQWRINHQHVILDINKTGVVSMSDNVDAVIEKGTWNEVWIPATTGDMIVYRAEDEKGNSLPVRLEYPNIKVGGYNLKPGNHVNLTIYSTLPGFVYESDTEGYDIVTFSPPYWDLTIPETLVKFYLPDVVPHGDVYTGTGLPLYDNIFEEDGRTAVYFKKTGLAPNARFEVAVSFPDRYMDEGAVTGGKNDGGATGVDTGSILGGLCDAGLSIFFCGMFVIVPIIFIISIITALTRGNYSSPQVAMDGVGANKNLDAVEAATLLRTDPRRVLTMTMFGLMKKGNVRLVSSDPVRLEPVSRTGVNYYEKLFMDSVKDGKPEEAGLLDCFKVLAKRVVDKTRPFCRQETEDYYRQKIDEAWEEIKALDTPELKLDKYDTKMIWLMADEEFPQKTKEYLRSPGWDTVYVPTHYWWYPYYFGLPPARQDYGAGPQSRPGASEAPVAQPSSGPATNQTTSSVEAFAGKVSNSVEALSAGVIGSVEGFLGVRNAANAPPPARPVPATSRSSGHTSCACVSCACACAHCACACACAGGGHGCT